MQFKPDQNYRFEDACRYFSRLPAAGSGFYENRQYKIDIPEDFNIFIYLKLHPDLQEQYSKNPIDHYLNYGYFENRKYKVDLPEDFNDEVYLKLHPDLNEQYSNNLKFHYCHYGYFENRQYKVV